MRKTTLIFVLLFLSSCGSLGWLGKSDAQKKLEEAYLVIAYLQAQLVQKNS